MKTRPNFFSNTPDTAVSRRVLLANPRGFCAGVDRAIEAVEAALRRFGAPVYVRRAIVHNRAVVERLEAHGAIFVQELDAVPEGAIVLLSAHGSSRGIKIEGQNRRLRLVDAVCPLVSKVHAEVEAWYRAGRHILLIGHHGHPEIIGTLGQVPTGAVSVISRPEDLDPLDLGRNIAVAYVVQTTYSVRDAETMISAIRHRFDDVAAPRASDICYATTNRQTAIEAIAPQAQLVLVVGDPMSSNARRLVEVAVASGCPQAVLVEDGASLPWEIIWECDVIGLTAAASTPEIAFRGVSDALGKAGFALEESDGTVEHVRFRPVSLAPLETTGNAGSTDYRLAQLRRDLDVFPVRPAPLRS